MESLKLQQKIMNDDATHHPLLFRSSSTIHIDDEYMNESRYLLSSTPKNALSTPSSCSVPNKKRTTAIYESSNSKSLFRRIKSLEEYIPSYDTIHELVFTIIWNVLFSSLSACICFWIPGFTVWGISITSMFKNATGCFFIAIATAFQGVKFQYFQTYLMYDAIKGGFLSVFTSFGNFIEDNDILLQMKYGFIKAPLNYSATILLSFICYQFGRLVALRWKAGAAFSLDLMIMENENHRIAFEIEKHEKKKQQILDEPNSSHDTQLEKHFSQQMLKRKKHQSRKLQGRHIIIMVFDLQCS
jgi:fluoride ion exporter CrcB/FEX